MLVNGGLNHNYFCVTDSFDKARDFAVRGVAGTIAIRNEETRRIGSILDSFNRNPSGVMGYEAFGKEVLELTTLFCALVNKVTQDQHTASLIKPHEQFKWTDAPHLDSSGVALLAGSERSTEISSEPPVSLRSDGCMLNDHKELLWGNHPDVSNAEFGDYAPISFLPHTLLLLMPSIQSDRRVMHRIPRRLSPTEQRGFILKCVF